MHGDAVVDAGFFDEIVTEDPGQQLFGLPRLPVSVQDHAVGFHASRLVVDNGTLQIGIGSLSDALVHSLMLRQRDNSAYRQLVGEVADELLSIERHEPFEHGLYGASEMFMDGFMHLYKAGILKREVFDNLERQQRAKRGETGADSGSGVLMDGGFFSLAHQASTNFCATWMETSGHVFACTVWVASTSSTAVTKLWNWPNGKRRVSSTPA